VKYYVLRRGFEFKTLYMDAAAAQLWVKAGWELGKQAYDSQYEALLALERWKVKLDQP
jgi:hypothetical protein